MTRLVDLTCFFFLYSFIGWICETIFCSIQEKRFVNRGFLNGPVCPVYGLGAAAIIPAAEPFMPNLAIVFLIGVVVTSAVEYVASFILEKLFHTLWWDYSDIRFNVNGRICLPFSLLFGVMAVALMFLMHPFFSGLADQIPFTGKAAAAAILSSILLADIAITVIAILKLNKRLGELSALMADIRARLEAAGAAVENNVREFLAKLSEDEGEGFDLDLERRVYEPIRDAWKKFRQTEWSNMLVQRRLFRAFPHLRSKRYAEHLRSVIDQWREGRRH